MKQRNSLPLLIAIRSNYMKFMREKVKGNVLLLLCPTEFSCSSLRQMSSVPPPPEPVGERETTFIDILPGCPSPSVSAGFAMVRVRPPSPPPPPTLLLPTKILLFGVLYTEGYIHLIRLIMNQRAGS